MEEIEYLVGESFIDSYLVKEIGRGMLRPYSDVVCDFLECLSKKIMQSKEAKEYQDIVSLGFWCRRSNILNMRKRHNQMNHRLGRGLAFHIAPSNVPINTFYSLFLGLLAGCKNVVRTSSKEFPQIRLVSNYINEILGTDFNELQKYIYIVRYPKESLWTKYFSDLCHVRIIWGGDDTINTITSISVSSRCKDIKFADRYSFAVIEAKKIAEANKEELKRIAHAFYNDTYLIDQNACSSPHMFFWLTDNLDSIMVQNSRRIFWEAVYEESLKYDFAEIKCTNKYTILCNLVMEHDSIVNVERYGNRIYVCQMNYIPQDIEYIRGQYGLFFEYESKMIIEILRKLSIKTQTCLYYGDIKERILNEIEENGLTCVDRIVPIGKSLDISEIWDGYNLIEELSRIIVCE